MPTTAQVSTVKAADPGLGFTLNFDQAIKDTLKVVITLQDLQQGTNTYSSEITLNNKIKDKSLVFVVPFGDNQYAPSHCMSFQIDVYVPNTASTPLQTVNGYVFGETGTFSYYTTVPTGITGMPVTGNMLQSEDGNYIGIYQNDGNFCVYPQSVVGQGGGLPPVYTTNSGVGQATNFHLVTLTGNGKGMCRIDINYGAQVASMSSPFPFNAGNQTYWTINSNGILCLNGVPMTFTKS